MTSPTPHLQTKLLQLKEQSRYRSLKPENGIDLSSNDYLGFRDHPALKNAALSAIENGISLGSGGSRLLRGNAVQHTDLEDFTADYFGSERALYVANGYAGNAAIFGALPSRHDVILFDSLIHASAREAIQHSHARHIKIPHNDLNAFEETLKAERDKAQTIWIAVESVYSMDGDTAPLETLLTLAQTYGAILIVDEAHGTGIIGKHGKGLSHALVQQFGHDHLITLHTCGKALGLSGGLICGSSVIIDTLINTARPFIYSTAPPPLMAALVQEALKLNASEEGDKRREMLQHLCTLAATEFGTTHSHIIPLILGDDHAATHCAAAMQEAGYDIRAIRPPTVPTGTARLRLSLNANLKPEALQDFAALYKTYISENRSAA